jgi:hypothetical protein
VPYRIHTPRTKINSARYRKAPIILLEEHQGIRWRTEVPLRFKQNFTFNHQLRSVIFALFNLTSVGRRLSGLIKAPSLVHREQIPSIKSSVLEPQKERFILTPNLYSNNPFTTYHTNHQPCSRIWPTEGKRTEYTASTGVPSSFDHLRNSSSL